MAQPKKIVQETFDAVVRENVEEFDMELEEAVSDAKQQFGSQGVDLSNIVTSYYIAEDGGLTLSQPVKGKTLLSKDSECSCDTQAIHVLRLVFQSEMMILAKVTTVSLQCSQKFHYKSCRN